MHGGGMDGSEIVCLVNNLHDQNKGSDKSRISQRRNAHHFPIFTKKDKKVSQFNITSIRRDDYV